MGRFSDDELYEMHLKGKISDDEYLAGIEANCKHVKETDVRGNKWFDSCKKCGMTLDSGHVESGSGGNVKVVKSGPCIVIAFLIVAFVLSGLYGIGYGIMQLVT